jgi:hypothetical protein
MINLDDPRLHLARQTVGAVRIIAEPNLPPRLLHVVDSRGRPYIAKRHADAQRFDQELRAYTTYLAVLRDTTPRLIAHHSSSRSLLLSMVPGRDCDGLTAGSDHQSHAHHQAGAALRRLHDCAADMPPGPVGPRLAERTRQWTNRADQAGLLSTAERHHLHSTALQLSGTAMDSTVCHLDFQPRNWRLNADGRFYILDFEHTRPDARVRDFARLEHRHWAYQPHLREAFFAGYGRSPSSADQQLLQLFGAIEAVTALVRGHETDDPALSAHGRTLLTRLF